MAPVGYQEGSEPSWWWKVADHIDRAQIALVNAMPYNVDDPRPGTALHERLCEAQGILLDIMRAKGLVPKQAPPQTPPVMQPVMQVPSMPMQFPPMQFAPFAAPPVPPPPMPLPIMSEPAVPAELIEREFGDLSARGSAPVEGAAAPDGHRPEELADPADEPASAGLPAEASEPASSESTDTEVSTEVLVPAPGVTLPLNTSPNGVADEKSAG